MIREHVHIVKSRYTPVFKVYKIKSDPDKCKYSDSQDIAKTCNNLEHGLKKLVKLKKFTIDVRVRLMTKLTFPY